MADTTAPTPKLNDRQRAFIGYYLGTARLNATHAARMAGYAAPHVHGTRLLANASVQAEIAAWRAQVRAQGAADIEYRVQNLDAMLQDFYQIRQERIDEWAALAQELDRRPETRRVYDDQFGGVGTRIPAGAGTGWIIRQVKMIGSGPSARPVEEFGVDTALVDRVVKVQDEIAKELGQRQENVNVSGSLRREYVIVRGDDEPQPESA